ncbi:hypothetical protein FA048_19490 [Pedobacter polaris]|uniref:Lipoprotein n=1 Tax=Pedobacter polaris TaxID=2571273 RepID=A0A4U1CFU1_9SPHI|nr:hypothetical protein [Pedobacter polaris]TKC04526.1 hypothetical protein FA048_19490 [Pedobacter polaris]
MKKLYSLLMLSIFLISCMNANRGFHVDVYLSKSNSYTKKNSTKLIQQNGYDINRNLITVIRYSRVGCNLIDSVGYRYNDKNRVTESVIFTPEKVDEDCRTTFTERERIRYMYDKRGKLISRISTLGGKKAVDTFNLIPLVDSLKLLSKYLSDIYISSNFAVTKNIVKEHDASVTLKFFCQGKPMILSENGVPLKENLDSVRIYIKNSHLTKDEFFFKNYLLTREYFYKNNILEKVLITNVQIESKKKTLQTEKFKIVLDSR